VSRLVEFKSHKFYKSTFSDKIPKVGNFIVLDGKKYAVKGVNVLKDYVEVLVEDV